MFNYEKTEKPKTLTGQRLRSYAFALLTRRDYSQAELIAKLNQYAINPDEVAKLVEELAVNNYQSDQRVAEQTLASQIRKGKGLQRIKQALKAKQLDEKELNGKIIFDWAKNGDEDAKFAINTLMENLADGITNITAVLNPEMIILGGGIMAQSKYLRPLIDNALKQRLVEDVYTHTKVDFAKLENDAGMLGALYNLLHQTM